jgi:hypothetical protein
MQANLKKLEAVALPLFRLGHIPVIRGMDCIAPASSGRLQKAR